MEREALKPRTYGALLLLRLLLVRSPLQLLLLLHLLLMLCRFTRMTAICAVLAGVCRICTGATLMYRWPHVLAADAVIALVDLRPTVPIVTVIVVPAMTVIVLGWRRCRIRVNIRA